MSKLHGEKPRFASMLVWLRNMRQRHAAADTLHNKRKAVRQSKKALTNRSILEYNQKTSIILPFDSETASGVFVLGECRLNVFSLEFPGEARQVEYTGDRGRKSRNRRH